MSTLSLLKLLGCHMLKKNILPTNSTALMKVLENTGQHDLDANVIRRSHDTALCDPQWLPVIAFAKSIGKYDGWTLAETDEAKRNLLRNAIEIHRTRGTPHSIKLLLKSLGFGDVDVLDNLGSLKYNGKGKFDGSYKFGGNELTWAYYRIKLNKPITIRQHELVTTLLNFIAPVRSELQSIRLNRGALKYDGSIKYDGQYRYGEY